MLLLQNNPAAAYRRVAVDARIRSARPEDLVALCFETVVTELGRAIRAHELNDPSQRSEGLTRANAAITALEMGLDRTNPLAQALDQLYAAARESILSSVAKVNIEALGRVRSDFAEIGAAMAESGAKPAELLDQ